MSERKKIGVLLAGSGFLDGAEIRESVLTLLALDNMGVETIIMAPNIPQYHVVDHLSGLATEEKRNVLVEAARIARGQIVDLATVGPQDLQGLILPGGFGVAKNFCDFALQGAQAQIHPLVRDFIQKVYLYNAPIGAIGMAPALLALLFGKDAVELTIGNDTKSAEEIAATGAQHKRTGVSEIYVDTDRKIVSTAGYMFAQAPLQHIYRGIEKLVHKVVEMA